MAEPRYFEDVEIGQPLESPGRTVTEADFLAFVRVSGDPEGLAPDDADPGVPRRVPDWLVIAFTSGLGFRVPVAPLPILAFMVVDWRFLAPVRIGDTLRCRMAVSAKRPMRDGGVVVEQRQILNQRDEVVQSGEYKLLVARRPREGR
jgi:acyl dehydratase